MNKSKLHTDLISQFVSIESEKDMQDFLEGILTPQELEELPKRLAIVRMLKSGIPQHQIAQELGVGVATVTRGSKEIQKGRFKHLFDKEK